MDRVSLAVVGVSHHTASVEVRERFALNPENRARALREMVGSGLASEAVLLSTCNRTEFYLLLPRESDPIGAAIPLLARAAGMDAEAASGYFYCRRDREAARHLFRVVSSLESMILGEAQIQGQVKDAYEQAAALDGEPRVVGPVLSRLFHTALYVGGEVRSRTALGTGAASIPSAAVELARKIFGALRGRRALVLGAGDMSELAIECLNSEGIKSVVVANRTESRAVELAARVGATTLPLERIAESLEHVDILATATSSPVPVVTKELIMRALPNGPRRPLFIIDMAIPRDVDPAVGDIDNVFHYDIDDLQHIVDANLERRQAEIAAAEALVAASLDDFWQWYAALGVVPVIRSIREDAEAVRIEVLEKALRRLSHLDEAEREAVEALSRQLMNKFLHEPTVRLRAAAGDGRSAAVLEAARYLFGLDGEEGAAARPKAAEADESTAGEGKGAEEDRQVRQKSA